MKKGQSTIEVVVLFIIVGVAVFLMQVYLKRAAQGKLRESADKIGGGVLWDYSDATGKDVVYYKNYYTNSKTVQDTYSNGAKKTTYDHFYSNQREWHNAVKLTDFQSITEGTN